MHHHSASLSRFVTSGDHHAFHELVEQYQRMVFLTCQHILSRCPAEVDDAVQETFLKLARSAGTIDSNLGAWLHTCARTTALNRLRSLRLRHRREGGLESSTLAVGELPQHPSDSGEDLSIVEEVVETLAREERELVVSYYYLGHTQQQIADALGLSQVAIQKRLKVVLEILRQRCTKRGLSLSVLAGFLDGHGRLPLSPSLLGRLAGMRVPSPAHAPAMTGIASVSPNARSSALGQLLIATALVLGMLGIGGAMPRQPSASRPPRADSIPSHVVAAVLPGAALAPGAASGFQLPLGGAAWTVRDLSAEPVHLRHAGREIPAWHLSTVGHGLIGVATIRTPHLPTAYSVELLVHTRAVICPFSSAGIEPCLSGRDPETSPLHEIDVDLNAVFTPDSWRLVRCEVRRDVDGSLLETTSVEGITVRSERLEHAPPDVDQLAIRVLDTDCDIASVTVRAVDEPASAPLFEARPRN